MKGLGCDSVACGFGAEDMARAPLPVALATGSVRELRFGDARSHGGGRCRATGRDAEHLVNEFRPRPFLMGKELHLEVAFAALDLFDVGQHPTVGKSPGEFGDDQAVGMEPSQRDELPHIPQLAQIVVEARKLHVGHARSVPIERWRQIVRKHLVRVRLVDAVTEFGCVGDARDRRFHPDNVGEGGVCNF